MKWELHEVTAVDVVCGAVVETPAVVFPAGVDVTVDGCVVVTVGVVAVLTLVLSEVVEVVITIGSTVDVVCGAVEEETPAVVVPAGIDVTVDGYVVVVVAVGVVDVVCCTARGASKWLKWESMKLQQ